MQLADLTETQIIDRILDGEKFLYELLVRRFNPCLYKIGRSYHYNHEDTQDLMQDTFIDAYKNLDKFERRSGFKTWIIRIMMNNCYHKKNKFGFKNEFSQDLRENSIPMFSNPDNDGNKIVHNRELTHIIEEALMKIPFDYRMVFSLREINGLSVNETSELLHITESNVKVRLNRAKALLRARIEKEYAATELFEFNLIYCDAIVENVMKKIYDC
ncbi:MAG: sigma-70 family RNA polymerase sigma factor [Chitinophagaceae bacterium]|nr:sigma-70 family RNA polymerase sigma factor [Chitinophagaceae bacterium]